MISFLYYKFAHRVLIYIICQLLNQVSINSMAQMSVQSSVASNPTQSPMAFSGISSVHPSHQVKEIESILYHSSPQGSLLDQLLESQASRKHAQEINPQVLNQNQQSPLEKDLKYSQNEMQTSHKQHEGYHNVINSFEEVQRKIEEARKSCWEQMKMIQSRKNHNDYSQDQDLYRRSRTPRPEFSAITAFNPAFRRLEQIRQNVIKNLTSSPIPSIQEGQRTENFFYQTPDDSLEIIPQESKQDSVSNFNSQIKSQSRQFSNRFGCSNLSNYESYRSFNTNDKFIRQRGVFNLPLTYATSNHNYSQTFNCKGSSENYFSFTETKNMNLFPPSIHLLKPLQKPSFSRFSKDPESESKRFFGINLTNNQVQNNSFISSFKQPLGNDIKEKQVQTDFNFESPSQNQEQIKEEKENIDDSSSQKILVEYDENGNRIPHLGPYDRSVFLYFKSHLDKSIQNLEIINNSISSSGSEANMIRNILNEPQPILVDLKENLEKSSILCSKKQEIEKENESELPKVEPIQLSVHQQSHPARNEYIKPVSQQKNIVQELLYEKSSHDQSQRLKHSFEIKSLTLSEKGQILKNLNQEHKDNAKSFIQQFGGSNHQDQKISDLNDQMTQEACPRQVVDQNQVEQSSNEKGKLQADSNPEVTVEKSIICQSNASDIEKDNQSKLNKQRVYKQKQAIFVDQSQSQLRYSESQANQTIKIPKVKGKKLQQMMKDTETKLSMIDSKGWDSNRQSKSHSIVQDKSSINDKSKESFICKIQDRILEEEDLQN